MAGRRGEAWREASKLPCGPRTGVRAAAGRQGQELVEQQKHHDGEDQADGEVDVDGAAAERGGGRGEQHGGGRDETAAEADDGDQRGQAAEDENDRLRIETFAGGEIAAPSEPEVAGGEQDHSGGDDVGLRLCRRSGDLHAQHPRRSPRRSAAAGDRHARGIGFFLLRLRPPRRLRLVTRGHHDPARCRLRRFARATERATYAISTNPSVFATARLRVTILSRNGGPPCRRIPAPAWDVLPRSGFKLAASSAKLSSMHRDAGRARTPAPVGENEIDARFEGRNVGWAGAAPRNARWRGACRP